MGRFSSRSFTALFVLSLEFLRVDSHSCSGAYASDWSRMKCIRGAEIVSQVE